MIVIKNPELRETIYNNIRSAVATDRKGIHLSDLIYCPRKAYFRKMGLSPVPTDELCVLWMTGFAFQAYMFPLDKEIPLLVDGIGCTPDVPTGIEVKSTRQSSRNFDFDTMAHWKKQILGYCKALNTLEYDLVVMFVCGNYCLHPDTKILKANLHWTRLGNLRVGDRLVGVDEFPPQRKRARRKLRYATVTSLAPVKLPSSQVTMEDGRVIISSDEHLWLEVVSSDISNRNPKWTKTKDLVAGSQLRQLEKPWTFETSYNSGYLAASLDSEGDIEVKTNARTTLRIGYSQKEGLVFEKVKLLLEFFGIPYSTNKRRESGVEIIRTKGMGAALRVLGAISPLRLRIIFSRKGGIEGMGLPATRSIAKVKSITPIGDVDLIGIETSTKTLIAEGLVSHNSPPFPAIDCWHIGATQEEVDGNWFEMVARRDTLEAALLEGEPPPPDCAEWEWKYCENIDLCQDTVCWRKKQLGGKK